MRKSRTSRSPATVAQSPGSRQSTGDPLFISYSRRDAQFAQELEAALRGAGIPVWLDHARMTPGDRWTDSIATALEKSRAVVLVISPDAVRSQWVIRETSFAARKNKPFIPLIYRSTKIPPLLDFMVGDFQWLDFTDRQCERGIQDLLNTIRELDKGEPAKSPKVFSKKEIFPVYVEDVQEFLPEVPRSLLWRIFSRSELSLWERVGRLNAIRPLGFFEQLPFGLLFFTLVSELAAPGMISDEPFMFFFWATAILVGFGLPFNWWFKREWIKMVSEVYEWLPYRPDSRSPNRLIDRWEGSIKPIVRQMLDRPVSDWDEIVSKRCPDPELAARLYNTMGVLLGTASK